MPELYQFQKEDVEKLAGVKAALIGSEMGVGKTHEGIALDEIWNPDGKKPTLIVAPLNTHSSWLEKYSEQSPSSDVVVIDRKNRARFSGAVKAKHGDVFIMHWDALRLMPELAGIEIGPLIADEVHRATNRKAQATRALKRLRPSQKLGMSGTATGDRPENIWSVLNWLWPTYYTSYWNFRRRYCIEEMMYDNSGAGYSKITGVKNAGRLHEEMDPWFVRHLKREQCCPHHPEGVMPWLPKKQYSRMWVDLNPTQKRIYDAMAKDMIAWIGEHEDTPFMAQLVVVQLARLSQIALATPEISWKTVKVFDKATQEWHDEAKMVVDLKSPSSKIDAVKELIKDHDEKQFVVFSASKKACYLAQQEFAASGITSEVLSGDTPDVQRAGMVDRFRRGSFQVFIGVIQAAGEGIDGLQHATDTAIFLDRSWSTIRNRQAEDRLDRPGTNGAHIIDVMARGTLDFGRHQKLEAKWSWIRTMLGDISSAQAAIAAGKDIE